MERPVRGIADHNRLLSVEGIDATGKTEIASAIGEALRARSLRIHGVHDPPELDPWPRVKQIIFDQKSEISEISEAWLFLAARLDLVQREVLPALSGGSFVIADRYVDSWVAYHCHRLSNRFASIEDSLDFLLNIHLTLSIAGLLPYPRRTWLIEEDPIKAMRRREGPATKWDTLETQQKVAGVYEMIATREPRRIRKVDARGRHLDEVRNQVVTEALQYCITEAETI